jgi:hypothetical protein
MFNRFVGNSWLGRLAVGVLLFGMMVASGGVLAAGDTVLEAGGGRVVISSDGLLRGLKLGGEDVCPVIIPWQAIWDGGQSNTGPDRRNGFRVRSNSKGVAVKVTGDAKEGNVAYMAFEHPDIRVRMRVELAENHLELTPFEVLNRRDGLLVGMEYPSAAFHPVGEHTEYVGVAWGGLAVQPPLLLEGASYRSECPQATHDLALLVDRPLSLATFSVQPLTQVPFRRTVFGLSGERAKSDGWTGLVHQVATWAGQGQTENLPPVHLAAGTDPVKIFDAYREANGMNEWPGLATKFRRMNVLRNAVHLKHDLNHFKEFGGGRDELEFLKELPEGPYLWEMVTYHGRFGLHDMDYPDFTIFADAHGGERMFRERAGIMHRRGDLVSVYTNPFWWQEDSEGTKALGGMEAIGVRRRDGTLEEQFYGNMHGFIVGAWRLPVIQQEVARLTGLRDGQGLDLVFQDVYGTRGEYDFAKDFHWPPYGFSQALIDMARYSSGVMPVAGEGVGLDRTFRYLTATMGFYLTTMNHKRAVFYDDPHSKGQLRQWPFGTLILRDKIAFYPHNLDVSILTSENLSWVLAAGMNMHYQTKQVLTDIEEGIGYSRLEALSHIQKTFCAPVFGERVTCFDFLDVPYELTRTAFANNRVLYASHDDKPQVIEQHGHKVPLAPHGFVHFEGETPVAALLQSKEHEGGMLSDWDPKAKAWKPVMPWKPTALRGIK